MATRLDNTKKHSNIPFIGRKGDDVFHFNIPAGEAFTDARLDILGGRYNAVARIEKEPSPGDTGTGKAIEVHWWFDGGTDLLNPPFIEYRIRAFTRALEKRAIVVAIENTGYIPFDIGITGDSLRTLEKFVDTISELGELQNAKRLFDNYYSKVEILVDTDCTKTKIRDALASLANDCVTDLAIVGHGGLVPFGSGNCVLILHGGMKNWETTPRNLTKADVHDWKTMPEFSRAKFGLVYMMNCYGSKFSDTWLDLGFKTSIGPACVNSMPEPMFTFFWTRYRNGEPAERAANKAWEDSRDLWQTIYHPDCHLESIPRPPFVRLVCEENKLITDSRSIVAGNAGYQITDTA